MKEEQPTYVTAYRHLPGGAILARREGGANVFVPRGVCYGSRLNIGDTRAARLVENDDEAHRAWCPWIAAFVMPDDHEAANDFAAAQPNETWLIESADGEHEWSDEPPQPGERAARYIKAE